MRNLIIPPAITANGTPSELLVELTMVDREGEPDYFSVAPNVALISGHHRVTVSDEAVTVPLYTQSDLIGEAYYLLRVYEGGRIWSRVLAVPQDGGEDLTWGEFRTLTQGGLTGSVPWVGRLLPSTATDGQIAVFNATAGLWEAVDQSEPEEPEELGEPVTYWDDLRFPANSVSKIEGKQPAADPETGLLLFDGNNTGMVAGLAQLPHGWKEGSTVYPHVHWFKTSSEAGDVAWRLEYKHSAIGGIMDTDWTEATFSSVAGSTPDDDTEGRHLITSLGAIDMTGFTISHCLIFRLARMGGDAADTYGDDAAMLEFDIHYEIDLPGSRQEYIKAAA